jgi:4-carboxymuconolactone decarboxylase
MLMADALSFPRGTAGTCNFKAPAGGRKLTEFIILLTAREWASDYEWYVHHPIALKAGLKPEIADAIAQGRRPDGMSEEEDAVYSFVTEIMRNKRVSDASYERIVKLFGEKGVIDITGVVGFYTTLAMVMNTTRHELPQDGKRLPRFPD